jgi:dTDP-4-amino-4,6-dideoxygalactose transaminase
VDPVTFNITAETVQKVLSPRTRAIITVHLFGLCADVEAILAIAPGIPVLEDAACAAGSAIRGRNAGTLGLAGAFSFHPRKSITTGEGGMVTTEDDALAERMSVLRSHGASMSEEQRHAGPRPYLLPEFNLLGFNYRMTDLQGAVGLVQLAKMDRFIDERARWAAWYHEELAGVPWLRLPRAPEGSRHGWQSFVCWVDPARAPRPRNELMGLLQEQGIATRPGTHAVHMLGLYRQRYGLRAEDFPNAAACDANTMAIPLHNRMVPADYQRVAEALRSLA